MQQHIHPTAEEMGRAAAEAGAQRIRAAIAERGSATIIVATGASQFRVLEALVKQDVEWSKITGFHLDEYIGLPLSHPASFRAYLKERFVDLVPLGAFHYVDGEHPDPAAECARLGALIPAVDVAFIGIGENAHIAFNDPPADFETEAAYIVVELDQACRQQQFGEGWFPSLDAVPRQAISMPAGTSLLRTVSRYGGRGAALTPMRIDHIQLAMPAGRDEDARAFFVGVLGMVEEPKPEPLRQRGGCWFRYEETIVHVGVDPDFRPQKKAHPAFRIADLDGLARRLEDADFEVRWDDALPDCRRFYTSDPFGNRIEFMAEGD